MTDPLALLRTHASVREYAPDNVPDPVVDAMLSAAQQASTDATGQLYSFVEVREAALRRRMAVLTGDQAHVRAAPRFFVVCLDVRRLRRLLERRGERLGIRPLVSLLFGITDAALFGQNLAVAAEALGLGICFIGGVQNESRAVAHELALPQGVVPLWGVTVGRPAARSAPKPRTPTHLVRHVDRYRDATDADLDLVYETMRTATRSGDWLNPIRKYFAAGGIMERREDELRALLVEQGLDPSASPQGSLPPRNQTFMTPPA